MRMLATAKAAKSAKRAKVAGRAMLRYLVVAKMEEIFNNSSQKAR